MTSLPPPTALSLKPRGAALSLPPSFTLLLPSVSIGNVGQLAIDLLLHNLPHTHVGHLRSPALLPFAGPSSDTPGRVVTALEVYCLQAHPVVIVQQRAPAARGRAEEAARAMVQWAIQHGCAELILLGSANAAGMRDRQLAEVAQVGAVLPGLRVAMTSAAADARTAAGRRVLALGVRLLEGPGERAAALGWDAEVRGRGDVEEEAAGEPADVPRFLPTRRRGFMRGLLEEAQSTGVRASVVSKFVHEGENEGDARVVAAVGAVAGGVGEGDGVDEVRRLCAAWKVPPAWTVEAGLPDGLY